MLIADGDLKKISAEAKETKQPVMDLLRRRYPTLSEHELPWEAMRIEKLNADALQA